MSVDELLNESGGYLSDEQLDEFAKDSPVGGLCGSCRWWDSHEPPTVEVSGGFRFVTYTGNCRRHAPAHILADVDDREALGESAAIALWPTTNWNDRCGDYTETRNGKFEFDKQGGES